MSTELTIKYRIWTKDFVFIVLVNAFMFTGFQMLPAALPPYLKTLGASDSALGMLSGISMVAALIARPLAGKWLDTIGRKVILLTGLTILTVSTTAFYFFPVVGLVLATRFIHGIGWGIGSTSCSTIAADFVPKPRFGEGMGYFGLSASLGMAIAPALALSMSAKPMIWISTAFSFGALIIACTLKYKKVQKTPKDQRKKEALYEKASLLPSVIMALSTLSYGAIITFIAVYAKDQGITQNIGWFFTTYAIIMILTRPFIGRLVDRKGTGIVIIPALLCGSAGIVVLSFATNFSLFLFSAALYGMGQGCMWTGANTMAVLNAPKGRVGAANSTFFTGFDVGLGIGAMVSGYVVLLFGYSKMFLIFSIFPAAGIIPYLLFKKHINTGPVKEDY